LIDISFLLCTKHLKLFWNDFCVDMGCFSAAPRDISLRQCDQTGSGNHPDKGTSSSVKGPRRLAG